MSTARSLNATNYSCIVNQNCNMAKCNIQIAKAGILFHTFHICYTFLKLAVRMGGETLSVSVYSIPAFEVSKSHLDKKVSAELLCSLS